MYLKLLLFSEHGNTVDNFLWPAHVHQTLIAFTQVLFPLRIEIRARQSLPEVLASLRQHMVVVGTTQKPEYMQD